MNKDILLWVKWQLKANIFLHKCLNSAKRRLRKGICFKHALSYSIFTVIIRLIAAVFNFSVNVVVMDKVLDQKGLMKHQEPWTKISVNLNICDLVPRDSSVFLILRNNTENRNANSVQSLNFKEEECFGNKIRKFEVSF